VLQAAVLRRWAPLLLAVGLLVAEAAWLLAVPAFRGIDEFDHVYRAASVARGEWWPSGDAARHGRGELVTVPRDLVAAAGAECRARPYTGHDNCAPVRPASNGQVRVASAASRYEPGFYWVVGTAARGVHGTAALYVMRAVSALLCAVFVALSAWSVRRWARTPWPAVALVASATPVLVYSSVVAAPNALEICAALSVWSALAGLGRGPLPATTERALLWAAVPGAVLLANLRSLGAPFLAVDVLVVVAVLGRRRVGELVARHKGTLAATGSLVAAAVATGVFWVLAAAPNRGAEEHGDYQGALVGSLLQLPVWVLQTIAAAPGRADPAPVATYLLCGALLVALWRGGSRAAEPRLRRALAFVAVTSLAGPLLLTLHTYRDVGVIWQGRYGMPFSAGLLVLAGLALDRRRATGPRPPVRVLLGTAFVTGQLVAVLAVLAQQRRVSPSVATGSWSPPAWWLVVALTLVGWSVVTLAVRGLTPVDGRRSGPSGPVAVDELAGELLEEQPHVGHDPARL
jgi:hypothetical protein